MTLRTASGRATTAIAAALSVSLLAACGPTEPTGFPGYIEGEFLYLAAPSAGYLDSLAVPRGSRVAAGAPVFSVAADTERQSLDEAEARVAAADARLHNLDQPRRQSEIDALAAQVRAAEAALTLSTQQVAQQEALAARGFIANARLDEVRAAQRRDTAQRDAAREQLATARATIGRAPELRAAQADAAAARAQVAQRRWQLERKVVAATVAGEVTETFYRPGEWVPPGAAVASLLPDTRRRLRFFVPETVVAQIAPGSAIEARCDGCTAPIRATVDFVAAQAEYTPPVIYSRGSREKLVFRVEAAAVAEQAAQLRPGLPIDVRLGAH